jgi:SagB-type dehydrogenase family enzyme
MQLRTSKTLIVIPSKNGIICHDYLSKVSIQCDIETLHWLSCFHTWSCPEKIVNDNPDYDAENLFQQFTDLQNIGLLIKRGSKAASQQVNYSRNWKFGLPSALLHLTCTDSVFISLEQSAERQIAYLRSSPPPPLFTRSTNFEKSIKLSEQPRFGDLLKLMATRRTNRTSLAKPLVQDQLLGCLFAGLGITAFTKTVAGKLPLKMTPSGGARNPFEAFVLVKNVQGMPPGFYHFSASECVLTFAAKLPPQYTSKSLLAGQDWAEDMAAIVFLVANFERTMWKYQDDNAYRVVLIEAGHIAQNIILAATSQGLTGCPTAALAHREIATILNLDGFLQNPIYAISLSYAKANPDKIYPNPSLPREINNCLPNQRLH